MQISNAKFERSLFVSFVVIILLLGAGISFEVTRLQNLSDEEVATARDREAKVTAAEQMRWAFATEIAAERGYLLTGNPAARAGMQEAEATFQNIVAMFDRVLTDRRLLVRAVQAAQTYRARFKALVALREEGVAASDLNESFERELLPARAAVNEALNDFARNQSERAELYYAQNKIKRTQWRLRARVFTSLLVLSAVAIAWRFSRRLGRAYGEERQLRSIAQRAVESRDELLGILAHDLRNPLAAITLHSALVESTAGEEKVREKGRAIVRLAQRMEELMKAMLDIATLEAGKFAVEPAAFDVAAAMQETEEMFRGRAEERQIRLRIVAPPDIQVMADRARILQVLSNLVGNALKFTPAGGEVAVHVAAAGNRVRFEIADTGPGIGEPQLTHLFDRYWTDRSSGKKGTGLGLYIVKGIVEAHGGTVSAKNKPGGGGAVFSFTLPRAH